MKGGFEPALSTMQAEVLMVPCEHDIFFPPVDSQAAVDAGSSRGVTDVYPMSSDWRPLRAFSTPTASPCACTIFSQSKVMLRFGVEQSQF